MKRVLVACEYSGTVRDVLAAEWDLIIAHPECTYITNAGVRWLWQAKGVKEPMRWASLQQACDFFNLFLDHPCPQIAVENPIPHGHGLQQLRRKYDQTIQPWQFGHPETKRTCLWLKGLPPLEPTENVYAEMKALPKKESNKVHYASPGPDRWKERSRTYGGIARAMAQQWS